MRSLEPGLLRFRSGSVHRSLHQIRAAGRGEEREGAVRIGMAYSLAELVAKAACPKRMLHPLHVSCQS